MAAAFNLESFIAKARKVHGDKYTYIKAVDPRSILYICPDHGKVIQYRTNHLNNQNRCPGCATASGYKVAGNKLNTKQYLKRLPKEFTLLEPYIGMHDPIKHKHSCGKVFTRSPCNMLKNLKCPRCQLSRVRKTVIQGHTFWYSGFEDHALRWIAENTNVNLKSVVTQAEGKVPKFKYQYNGKSSVYTPDIFIPSRRIIVEVKSTATMGLEPSHFSSDPRDLFYRNRAKARQVTKEGFRFKLLLITKHGGRRITLPKNWMNMTYTEFKHGVRV